jgi:hypothetical protein
MSRTGFRQAPVKGGPAQSRRAQPRETAGVKYGSGEGRTRYTPNDRPTISFMISFAPP